jgi:hypothetical protein
MAINSSQDSFPSAKEEIHAELEKSLINEYLKRKGYSPESLGRMLPDKAHKIMSEASLYASGKLAEIENKARYSQDLQGNL